ncbi:GAF and ANTAR domain-containing protein [Geodermatophilus normandii]|uniref:GAF and ANTAR domain-containing protein n=1 Tax=Geodermatophilus normandii TaxID=1137989 RepID=A0A6P0GIM2_9ACTN|nr:GAF and ANTAR domain-containing protein [Geodermatophilus normandii]NEM07090.1 GAF and ANTAR domain-containing protein [Geodermatophilus normandii]
MTDPAAPSPTRAESGPSGQALDADLGAALAQMAGLVLSRETVETALELVTSLAATTTAGTLGAGVTVVDEHGKRSRAASNAAVEEADVLQYELDEGPCLTAWRTRELVRIDDTTTDSRWPRWNDAASRLGVRSVLSAPLLVGDESVGAMKVYCERPMNYGRDDEHVMRLLAGQAAILLANSQSLQEARRLGRQLTEALASRDVISRATGVLLARGARSEQDAFATLTATARQAGRSVQDVADALVAAVAARNARAAGA